MANPLILTLYQRVTLVLCDVHWVRLNEKVGFKNQSPIYWCIHVLTELYMIYSIQFIADTNRLLLRMSLTVSSRLTLVAVDDLVFPSSGSGLWNR